MFQGLTLVASKGILVGFEGNLSLLEFKKTKDKHFFLLRALFPYGSYFRPMEGFDIVESISYTLLERLAIEALQGRHLGSVAAVPPERSGRINGPFGFPWLGNHFCWSSAGDEDHSSH